MNCRWKISSITTGQQAESHGVQTGWYIKEIDGASITESNYEKLKEKLKKGEKCTITFLIEVIFWLKIHF